MTHGEVSQLSIFEMAISGWRLAFESPVTAFLVILSFISIFLFIAKSFEASSIRDLFVNKSDVIEARKKLGIKEK
ncbi:hypothetical protein I7Z51_002498 [Vibrio parahaemolyticus]|uniref:hypothetical protein n=1 Tax=Vibrio TaxID=662 RepID=UPI001A8D53F6|nr:MULTISPECIES: hypothetical protein [Vibrio]EGQ7973575.1 hypothetical protein [Vibrio parahaemolyticus]MBO0209782.1 hypothetical protein [Vibrio sp. Vb0877]MCR9811844.1 hypothetical protein [Vibrio parahaemolyticus]MDW2320296.1 hypothetical protein [Vibrio sp. 1159]